MSQKSLRNLSLLLLLYEFNNFSSIIDIIDNIISASGTRHQNSSQWQCSITVTRRRLYHVTSILHCHWSEFWSRDTDAYLIYIYTFWYNFDTVLCQDLKTGTSDRYFIGIVKVLRFSSFSLHPLSIFLYSPFNLKNVHESNCQSWQVQGYMDLLFCSLLYNLLKNIITFFSSKLNRFLAYIFLIFQLKINVVSKNNA